MKNINKLMLEGDNLVLPFKYLKIIKQSVKYALILIDAYLNSPDDYFLMEEEIKFYNQLKTKFIWFSQSLDRWDDSIILPFEGALDVIQIIAYASDCLNIEFYENCLSINFYDLYFSNEDKLAREKNFKIINGLYKKLDNLYNIERLLNH